MNFFRTRRGVALSALKLPDDAFVPLEADDAEAPSVLDQEEFTEVLPPNELVTTLIEMDIAEAVRTDHPERPQADDTSTPMALLHLQSIDRMVAHLKADEKRLAQEIVDAKKRLADIQLTRRGYEKNSSELRRGIAAHVRPKLTRTTRHRQPRRIPAPTGLPAEVAEPLVEGPAPLEAKPPGRQDMH